MKSIGFCAALASSLIVAAPNARAQDEVHYTLEGGKIVIEKDGIFEDVAVDCEETFALVQHDGRLYVACGARGVAIYSLDDPAHPVLSGRIENGPCVHLASDGTCAVSKVAPRVRVGGVTFAPFTPLENPPAPERPVKKRPPFTLKGVHAFGGLVMMLGGGFSGRSPGSHGVADQWGGGGAEFLFGFRGGVLVDQHEVAVELSPGTYAMESHIYARETPACGAISYYYNRCSGGPVFQLNGTYRHLFRLHGSGSTEVFWPLGAGIGLAKETSSELVYFQARADVLGVTIRTDRLVIDLYFPSFRYGVTHAMMAVDDPSWIAPHCRTGGNAVACTSTTAHMLSWLVGVGASYVF